MRHWFLCPSDMLNGDFEIADTDAMRAGIVVVGELR